MVGQRQVTARVLVVLQIATAVILLLIGLLKILALLLVILFTISVWHDALAHSELGH